VGIIEDYRRRQTEIEAERARPKQLSPAEIYLKLSLARDLIYTLQKAVCYQVEGMDNLSPESARAIARSAGIEAGEDSMPCGVRWVIRKGSWNDGRTWGDWSKSIAVVATQTGTMVVSGNEDIAFPVDEWLGTNTLELAIEEAYRNPLSVTFSAACSPQKIDPLAERGSY
jgi:hypothetical protein